MARCCPGRPEIISTATVFSNLPSDLQILPLFVEYNDLVPFVRLEPHRLEGVLLDELHPTVLVTHPKEEKLELIQNGCLEIGQLTWRMSSKSPNHNKKTSSQSIWSISS